MIKGKGRCISRGLWPVLVASLIVSGCNKDDVKGPVRTRDANGVETVLNCAEPYKINGKAVSLVLERELSIDTENEAVIKTGLGGIFAFDADPQGNIYILVEKGDPNFIFKFDPQGRFLGSFARMGQGPGELQAPNPESFRALPDGTLAVSDRGNSRMCIYDPAGKVIKETTLKSGEGYLVPLGSGCGLTVENIPNLDPKGGPLFDTVAGVSGGSLGKPRELDRVGVENLLRSMKFKGTYYQFSWGLARDRIITGDQEREYEVRVFDLEGRPVRIIRKEHPPLPVPEDYKVSYLKQYDTPLLAEFRKKIYFPEAMPPYEYLFADEDGRVFVVTYEKGPNEGERMCDVFDPEGVFVARVGLPVPEGYVPPTAKSRAGRGRIYCLREKANDFEELVVYKMMWK